MGICPWCGMPDPKRSTEKLRYDHENEALAQAELKQLYDAEPSEKP